MPAAALLRHAPRLLPPLALALTLALLLNAPAARAGASPGPGLTYDPFNGLYLAFSGSFYYDPATGYTYGPDLSQNYAPNPGGATIYSNSVTEEMTYVDTPVSVTDDTFSTTVDALLGGRSVFSVTLTQPFADPTVQAAVAEADAALTADGVAPGLPSLVSSSLLDEGSRTATVPTTSSVTGITQMTTQTFGAAVIGPGISTPIGASGVDPTLTSPYYFYVLPGQQDINTNIDTQTTVDRTVTTTTTDLLSQTYDIVGTPAASAAVPEPSPMALLALGLLPVGLIVRRRQKNPA